LPTSGPNTCLRNQQNRNTEEGGKKGQTMDRRKKVKKKGGKRRGKKEREWLSLINLHKSLIRKSVRGLISDVCTFNIIF
jgi:hypothetical protein